MRQGDDSDAPQTARAGVFDLRTELGRDLAAVDWASTGVGPPDMWPASLVNTVRLMTGSKFAMWMAWGADLTFFCNDAYRLDTLAAKYPWALGRPAREVWAEIWPDIGPRIDSVVTTGEATWDQGLLLFLERSGYVEETYHTFSYSPVTGDDGRVAGMLCVVSEDTARVVGARRMALLRDLGGALAGASTVDEVGYAMHQQLSSDPWDLPFAMTYLFDPDARAARLRWSSGVAAGADIAPLIVRADERGARWHPALFGAAGSQLLTDLTDVADLPVGGWAEPPRQALSVPLLRVGEQAPYGYLIAALNLYRELDEDYRGFVELVAGQLAAAIARARAFEQERDRSERLAELDRAKTTFFTNVSHELRTPLTLLLGPAEDALNEPDSGLDATSRRRFEVVQRNGERLLKLVNTLLDFSRLEAGSVEPVFEQLDLRRYTVELTQMFESAFERAGLRLTIDCAALPKRPYVDREMWSKIVLNLVSNALKATFTGGVTVRLRAAAADADADADADAEEMVLEVADTGVGIPVEEQPRLFERFHRVTGAQLRSHEGSGVGLALVAELAALHGGSVEVLSEPGVGSTFTVRIPFGRAHLSPARVADTPVDEVPEVARYGAGYLAETLRWVTPRSARPAGDSTLAGRPRILVVDDNPDMRDYVSELLARDYAVDSAADGAAALERVRAAPPDLVLTDVMMPVLDGFGLLAAVRADPATMHIPVVMLSARSGDDATVEGLDAGADDYLVKPFSARELLARVRANLELDRTRRLVAELQRTQELLDHAESLAHVGSWEVDLETEQVWMSPELHRINGVAPGAEPTVSLSAALSTLDEVSVELFNEAADEALAGDKPIDVELHGVRPDGMPFLVRVRAVATKDGDGRPLHLRGSTQDITEQRAAEIELAAAHAEREAAAREHAIATELQQSLLPPRSFHAPHLEIAAYYRAGVEGTQVGGDWQDVIDLGDGRTALVIGDVMGRGVRAAAVMGQLRAAVRAYARLALPPARVVRLLDETVREISADTIVTCVYAVFDPARQTLDYCNAGHLPPLLTDPDGTTRQLVAGGPPLGASNQADAGETVALTPGTLVTMYTDGLVERRGSDLDDGIAQLAGLVSAATVPLADLPTALTDALLADAPDDDVALLLCRVKDEAAQERSARHVVEHDDLALARARAFVGGTLTGWGVGDDIAFDAELAVSELATNALKHGQPPVQVTVRSAGAAIVLEVLDAGPGAPRMTTAQPDAPGGRGLLIVAAMSASWGVRPAARGKTVWCRFEAPPASAAPMPTSG
ncbi:SpoIIE family protein phosphatase [uncultured Jatrophihabitans sp.]|uniref:SpoIIE family protein phosphatase n=1 Tax=uncultured Jatrophihabitans sp. TaxID=1610747 RepID=UPI0035CC2D00